MDAPPTPVRERLGYAALWLGLAAALALIFGQLHYQWNWAAVWSYREKFWTGWLYTIALSLGALLLSALIGTISALASRSRFFLCRAVSKIYVSVIRSTPLLVQILVFFYVVAAALQVDNRYLVGIFTLAVFSGAYVSEIIRAGLDSLPAAQLESARAIGLTAAQTYRHVIFPQAFRQMLPPLAGQYVSLIKDSSLLSIIGIRELTLNAQEVNAFTYSTLESYLPLALGYLLLTWPLAGLSAWLERRLRYEY